MREGEREGGREGGRGREEGKIERLSELVYDTSSPQADAEEVCTILREVFQLVYTEATIQQLNESITAGEKGAGPTVMSQKRTRTLSKGIGQDWRCGLTVAPGNSAMNGIISLHIFGGVGMEASK